jgi:hypothetical protein
MPVGFIICDGPKVSGRQSTVFLVGQSSPTFASRAAGVSSSATWRSFERFLSKPAFLAASFAAGSIAATLRAFDILALWIVSFALDRQFACRFCVAALWTTTPGFWTFCPKMPRARCRTLALAAICVACRFTAWSARRDWTVAYGPSALLLEASCSAG